MIKLVRIEIKKSGGRTYLKWSLIMFLIFLGTIFLFAYAPSIEPSDPDMKIFTGYHNVIHLFSIIEMVGYTMLLATLYSRNIIEEYGSKRNVLLFMYPVKRRNVFLSKVILNSGFVFISVIINNIIIYITFLLINQRMLLVNESFNNGIILDIIFKSLLTVVFTIEIGIVAMGGGFIKNSMPTTIISAVIMASVLSNLLFNASSNYAQLIVPLFLVLISFAMLVIVNSRINRLEV